MPDENTSGRDAQPASGGRDASTTSTDTASKYSPSDLGEAMKIIAALEKRVGERDESLTSLRQRMDAIETANRRTLEQTGNWEQLAKDREAELATLKPVAERATALEAVIRESNSARIETIPEAMRSLIPTDYSPERLQGWLNANMARLTAPPPPRYDAGAGTAGGKINTLTPEQLEMAKRFGVSAEEFAKQLERKAAQGG